MCVCKLCVRKLCVSKWGVGKCVCVSELCVCVSELCVFFCIHTFSDPLKRFLPAVVTCDGSVVETSGQEKVKNTRWIRPSVKIIRSSARTRIRLLSQKDRCL